MDLNGSKACIWGRSAGIRATPLVTPSVFGTANGVKRGGRPRAARAAGSSGMGGHGAGGRPVAM